MRWITRSLAGIAAATLVASCQTTAAPAGAGALDLDPEVAASYQGYLAHAFPGAFAVTEDGMAAGWNWCEVTWCRPGMGMERRAIEACQRKSETTCYLYARGRDIVWRPPTP